MYQIPANASGTRNLLLTEEHLVTIRKYSLFADLIDSTGIVDEEVLEKLRFTVRSLIESSSEDEELLDFCEKVLFHDNMKAFGLHQLIQLYANWLPLADMEEAE